ncbi:protein MAIN-LIKE 1-like [Lathyrus oleraceus]|uniref:protein MAIN-LIKE 1-like n=1 Tax=Pisum sativum TaxID=3888 RepID=UPI0021CECDD8|nr:protein MAIN-LIKE 1-like [Pisum sativum]
MDTSTSAAEPTGYLEGLYDTSLLVKCEHHVARHLWFSEERGSKKELKVAGHRLKLTSRVPLALPQQMESWLFRSGLSSLQRTVLTKIDTNLISAFMEIWHLETSSFHMSFGEISITLDDVSCVLHLPIRGVFFSPQDVTEEVIVELVVGYLGVSQSESRAHRSFQLGICDYRIFVGVGGFHNFCRQDLYACRGTISLIVYGLRQVFGIQLGNSCIGY